MKISFVFPPFFLDSMYNLPPLGLINLATLARSQGHDATIQDLVLAIRTGKLVMDRTIYDQSADIILSTQPEVVAFSAQCTTYPTMIRIAEKIKKAAPRVKIVAGGHNASFVDELTLEHVPAVDAVVRGEGELTLGELLQDYAGGGDGRNILGVTTRVGSEIRRNPDRPLMDNLDDLPLPDYSLVPPLSVYREACQLPRSIAILEVGRGCPHRCIYCSESALWRRRTRTFSVKRLVKEMHHLSQKHGAQCFLLAYDQFTARRRFVEDFCREVMAAGLNHLPWYCISRLDTVDADLLRRMREAGCESMCYGIDSGSPATLAFIGKQIDEKILYRRVQETTAQGMVPTLSFVIGFPEEQPEDVDATLMLALKTGIQGNSNPLIQMPTVLPGTGLYKNYRKRLVRAVDTYFALGLEFDNGRRLASDDALIDAYPDLFSSFYNLAPRGLSLTRLNLIATYFPIVVNLYPKSFLLLATALKRSLATLFLDFLKWVQEKETLPEMHLSPADCFRHAHPFVTHQLDTAQLNGWDHLDQVVLYEDKAVAVAKPSQPGPVATVDISRVSAWKLRRKPNLLTAPFTKNLPRIIADLKAGHFSESYPDKAVWLVFYQDGNTLEVTEINAFGKDFLALCDGAKDLEAIAGVLYKTYGGKMSTEDFTRACFEAAEGLVDLNFLLDAGHCAQNPIKVDQTAGDN